MALIVPNGSSNPEPGLIPIRVASVRGGLALGAGLGVCAGAATMVALGGGIGVAEDEHCGRASEIARLVTNVRGVRASCRIM
jgi:hypothetical protein